MLSYINCNANPISLMHISSSAKVQIRAKLIAGTIPVSPPLTKGLGIR